MDREYNRLSTRAYDSPLRAEQARQTRQRIVLAARAALLERGYAGTTMPVVARAAGVSVQTVYNAFSTKAELAKRVWDVTLAGDDEPVPLAERPAIRELRAQADPRRYLQGYARLGRVLLERLAPLTEVLLDGARAGDPELSALMSTVDRERLQGATGVARDLSDRGGLRPDVSVERARDAIWALNSVELWSLLVRRRGWSLDEYEQWMARAMCDAVLADPG